MKENGAIAQLGERLPCTQEASGSIPLSSTIKEVSFKLNYVCIYLKSVDGKVNRSIKLFNN